MQDFTDSTQVIAFIGQSGLGLPNRDYYLQGHPPYAAARKAYQQHIARMFVLLGRLAQCRGASGRYGDGSGDAARQGVDVRHRTARFPAPFTIS